MTYREFMADFPAIQENFYYSEKVVASIRNDLEAALQTSPCRDAVTVVTTGSYGRMEASESSDLDLFVFCDAGQSPDSLAREQQIIRDVIEKYISKEAGDTGTFGPDVLVHFDTMRVNIGGDHDSNKSLTRRMLFLLEGCWLYGEHRFNDYRADLLSRYIKTSDPEKQISRFLLNDVIRYYRTMATDFEFKVAENNKPWGLRNVKLRFSRKILYFGGILCIAETALTSGAEKIDSLTALLNKSVLERIFEVGRNNSSSEKIFVSYNAFLGAINDANVRRDLDGVSREDRLYSDIYCNMRNESKAFSSILVEWLKYQYAEDPNGNSHPIHHSLIF